MSVMAALLIAFLSLCAGMSAIGLYGLGKELSQYLRGRK